MIYYETASTDPRINLAAEDYLLHQADGGTVGLEPGIGASGKQLIQRRGLRLGNCVARTAVPFADAIHNY